MTEPDFIAALDADRAPVPQCSMGALLTALDAKDPALALKIRTALAAAYTGASIGRELRRRGYRIQDTTVQRHRRHVCQCAP